MKGNTRIWTSAIVALLLAFGAGAFVFAQEEAQQYLDAMTKDYAVPEILPPDVTIETEYAPGPGDPVGSLDIVQNNVWVIHANAPGIAYQAKKERAVYQGDTIFTDRQSVCVVVLKDKSSLTLGAITKLVIDKSVYDPQENKRESLFSMLWGKVRCVVQKIASTGQEDFKVNTPMATLGVRGSDFVIALVPSEEIDSLRQSSWLESFELVPSAWAQSQGGSGLFVATGPATSVGVLPTTPTISTPPVLGPHTLLSGTGTGFYTTPFSPTTYATLLSRMGMNQVPVLRMPELLE